MYNISFMFVIFRICHFVIIFFLRLAPLAVHIQPREKVVDVGKQATFVCVISGFPVTSVSWTKNGNLLIPSTSFHFPSQEILQIPSIHREDKGMYQCFVENEDEIAHASAELRLGGNKKFFFVEM